VSLPEVYRIFSKSRHARRRDYLVALPIEADHHKAA